MERWPLIGFRSEKAAQAAAYFAGRSGAPIDKLKLIKLIYLTEREFLFRHEMPMLFDEYYSLEHGPICSSALNGINGDCDPELWSKYIRKQGNQISAVEAFSRDDLDELSRAEWDVLSYIWDAFGHMTAGQLRNYSHRNCPEYTEVSGGALPIQPFDILVALGVANPSEAASRIAAARRAEVILSFR